MLVYLSFLVNYFRVRIAANIPKLWTPIGTTAIVKTFVVFYQNMVL